MIKKLIVILLIYILTTGCAPMGDCTHNFTYQGNIKANDTLLQNNLVIRFDNLGNVIFKTQSYWQRDTAIITNNGNYRVVGNFFTSCASDENIFDNSDSIGFKILHKGQIIKEGKFKVLQTTRQYNDSGYFTKITLPIIEIN